MDLQTPVEKLFMVGPTYARRLKKLNIFTIGDLLYHFPFRYDDYSIISPIKRLQPGQVVTVQGNILEMKNEYTKYGKKIQKGKVTDQSGEILVIWFNQPFLARVLKIGATINLSGKVGWFDRKISLVSPEYEILKNQEPKTKSKEPIHTGRLVPVYHETYGISSKWLRSRISSLLTKVPLEIEDFLPKDVRNDNLLVDLNQALHMIHFPEDAKQADLAKERLAFEEMLLIHLNTLGRKMSWKKKKVAYKFAINQDSFLGFLRSLPFNLTGAQKKVLREILADLQKSQPMNRLLEGDVGSGKTVVAAAAIYLAYLNRVQSALMAPTEILAQQHFNTLNQILAPLGVKIELLTGSHKKLKIKNYKLKIDLLIGTHALIYKRASFKNLGLVIIDEQHRFGVEQRAKLVSKGKSPHMLTMTATPIPRTVALTLYGDLDLSVIDEMPPGRQKVKTWLVPPVKREAAYLWIRKQIKDSANQAFVICPLIDESEAETLQSVKAVTSEFERLKKEVFPDLRLGLLHGRLKSTQKNEVLGKFKAGQLDLLVSTPVVEVGIDVPAATIMLIEGAERFGLAQLHQLRGRVGRGLQPSYCLLFTDIRSEKITQRLKAVEQACTGIELAELDLKLRGPGEIFGTSQHGFFDLKMASFSDLPLIEKTKKTAMKILAQSSNLKKYPLLQARLKQATMGSVEPN